MEHLFQISSNELPLDQTQPDTAQLEDYCQEIMQNGKKHHSCTFPNCGKIFRFKSEFVRHQLTHNPQRHLDCPYQGCTKTFKREDALQNHLRIHTGEMPFQCEVPGCEQSFPTKAGLRYHYLKHKGEKECRCSFPGCNKTFLTMSQLKQHESTVNYHQKIIPQTPVMTKKIKTETEAVIVEKEKDLCFDDMFDFEKQDEKKVCTETIKVGKGKDLLFGKFVEPEVKQVEKLEWGFKDQGDADDVPSTNANDDLQGNFERMVKMISTENTAMKNKIDMCNTLMALMQENKELKSKLNKVPEYGNQIQSPAIQDFSDDKIFSFLNFNSPVKNKRSSIFEDGFFSFDI